MISEREKMLSGAPYDPQDAELLAMRLRARALCQQFGALSPYAEPAERSALLAELFGIESDVYVTPPFHCDYGVHIRLGKGVYFNFDCVVLDVARVDIGDRVLFGPAVQIYTALHPMDCAGRASGIESACPVAIGNDVWVGGGAILCPGVTIGACSVIGAGSVVVRDVPESVFAAGNPCRVIRKLAREHHLE